MGAEVDVGILNGSTLVSDDQCRQIAAAVNQQFAEDVLPAWGRERSFCLWLPGGTGRTVPAGVLPIWVLDSPDVSGALGYHDEGLDGLISGKVFAKPVLDAGGGILDPGSIGDSVSAVVSHEAIEAKFDPNINLWADGPLTVAGQTFASVAFELCDPVQAGAYRKGGQNGVLVSDFVLRAWFDPHNAKGPFNFLQTLKSPLSVDSGGYAILRNAPGSETSVFGESGNLRPWRAGNRRARRLPSR